MEGAELQWVWPEWAWPECVCLLMVWWQLEKLHLSYQRRVCYQSSGERERERKRGRRERETKRGRRGRESILYWVHTYVDAQKYDSYMHTVRIAIQYMSILLYQK